MSLRNLLMSRAHRSRYDTEGAPDYDSETFTRLLYVRSPSPVRILAGRLGLILVALALAVVVFWTQRDHLKDASGDTVGFSDVLYFTLVTVTTVGYGDIVPVGEQARLVDALVVTPIRLFIWLMFLGTAYEFFWKRIAEDRRMKKLQEDLHGHVIVCGYGYAGSSAARLLAAGPDCPKVIAIDIDPERLELAAADGFIGLRGDCTRDIVLHQAGIETAGTVLICIRRDEVAALATLTARNLNNDVRILAMVKDQENLKLLQRAGAQEVIAPSRLAGFLMADAVHSRYSTRFVNDLLAGPTGFIRMAERVAHAGEVGKSLRDLPGLLVVAVERGGRMLGFWQLPDARVEAGDLLFAIEANPARGDIETAPPIKPAR